MAIEKKIQLSSFVESLRPAFKNSLPGSEAHKLMIPKFQGIAPEYFSQFEKLRDAAVLIILFEENDRIKTVFIERMPDPGPHSGQIAFPGGKFEISDVDLIETALREALEEIGVEIDRNNVVGELTPIQIPISGFSVLPVVCTAGFVSEFKLCEIEVKDAFVVDLFELLNTETVKKITARGVEIDAPCFLFEDRIIWGATAMVLNELKTIINQI